MGLADCIVLLWAGSALQIWGARQADEIQHYWPQFHRLKQQDSDGADCNPCAGDISGCKIEEVFMEALKPAHTPSSINVLTFNMENGVGFKSNGTLPMQAVKMKKKKREKPQSPKLNTLFDEMQDANVIFLQEYNVDTRERDLAFIRNMTGKRFAAIEPNGLPLRMDLSDRLTEVHKQAHRVAILFDEEVFSRKEATLLMMTKPSKLYGIEKLYTHVKDRVAMVAKLTHLPSGRDVNFVNFHLDAIYDKHKIKGREKDDIQSYHREQVADVLAKSGIGVADKVVIGGDTNLRLPLEASPTLCHFLFRQHAADYGLKDACGDSLKCLNRPTHFPHKFHEGGPKDAMRMLGKVGLVSPARLDILVTNLNIRRPARILRTSSLSDHHAVSAYFEMNADVDVSQMNAVG